MVEECVYGILFVELCGGLGFGYDLLFVLEGYG